MAEQGRSPSPPKPPADAMPPLESINKRKDGSPGSPAGKHKHKHKDKRPRVDPELQDTATSKLKIEKVDMSDFDVLKSLLSYRTRNGIFPFEDRIAMENFRAPWLRIGLGNKYGWELKIEQVKRKFRNRYAPFLPDEQKEFELWLKIWGREGGGGPSRAALR